MQQPFELSKSILADFNLDLQSSNKGSFRLTAFVPHIHGKFDFIEAQLKTEKAIVTPFIRDGN